MRHLCIIIDRFTQETICEYEIEAKDWYYARHQSISKFHKDFPDKRDLDFYVDSIEIDKEKEK